VRPGDEAVGLARENDEPLRALPLDLGDPLLEPCEEAGRERIYLLSGIVEHPPGDPPPAGQAPPPSPALPFPRLPCHSSLQLRAAAGIVGSDAAVCQGR